MLLAVAVASASDALAVDDAVVRYSFNRARGPAAVDETGMARDAELFAGAHWADGAFGAAIGFPATGAYLQVRAPDGDRLDFDVLSVSAWVRPDAVGGRVQYLVAKGRGCCSDPGGYGLRIGSDGRLGGEIWLSSDAALVSVSGAAALEANRWTHVALTFDGRTLALYVDGVWDGATQLAASDVVLAAGDPLSIGALVYGRAHFDGLHGRVDELRLYDRALTGAEVADLHAAPGGEPGLLFYESFDSEEGIAANGGAGDGYAIEPGLLGNAVRIFPEMARPLDFPTAGNIDFSKGAISFWFKPDWDGDVTFEHYLFEMYDDVDHPPLQLRKWYGGSPATNRFVFRFDGIVDGANCTAKPCNRQVTSGSYEPDATMRWRAGEWHHVAVSWDFTLPDAEQFMAFIIDGTLGDAVETYRVSGSFDAPRFAVGSRFNGALAADGWIDDLRIYAEPVFRSRDPKAAYIAATRGDGIWQAHETIHDAARDAPRLDDGYRPAEDVFFWVTPPFAAVYEGSVPDPSEVVEAAGVARYRAARGDAQTLFFNVYSRIDLEGATLSIGSLTGSGGAIDAASIDLRVVKNWWQASAGHERRYYPPVYTPELLLSDDRVDLAGQVWSRDELPSLPVLGHAVTDIDAYTSKQFAIELAVPADAAPGVYSGVVGLSAPGLSERSLAVELEVLDIALEAPDKDFIVYHRGNYSNAADPDYLSQLRYEQQLRDIRAHGFNRLYLRASDTSYFDKAAAEGFAGLAISQVRDVSKLEAMLGHGMEPFFYGIDEPNSLDAIRAQIERSKEIRAMCSGGQCGKVITAITKEWADRLWDPGDPIYQSGEYEPLDCANLHVAASEAYLGARRRGERAGIARKEYPQVYYWQIRREDPRVNRYYAGFHLWLTDLDGIYPYVYQSIDLDPYDDFDFAGGAPYHAAKRDGHASYPSPEGPVPTIEWKALREGIDDYRYLQTWEALRERVTAIDPPEAARSAAAIDAALQKYRAADALEAVEIAAYDADRQRIAAEILALQAYLDSQSDAGPVPEPRSFLLQALGGLVVAALALRRRRSRG